MPPKNRPPNQNHANFLTARRKGFFPPKKLVLPTRSLEARIFGKAIGPVLKTDVRTPTAEQKRQSQRRIFTTIIQEIARTIDISPEEKRALFKLSTLFARHINSTHQPGEILQQTVHLTAEEKRLAKILKEESVGEVYRKLSRIGTKIEFDTMDRYAFREQFPENHEKEELVDFSKRLYFRIAHDIFHSRVAFQQLFQEARKAA